MLNNSNNRNRFYKKRKNQYNNSSNDVSNNDIIVNESGKNIKTDTELALHVSNETNLSYILKMLEDINKNIITHKNNINPTVDCNIMTNNHFTKQNKLITCLDNNDDKYNTNKEPIVNNNMSNNDKKNNIDRDKTNLLLKILLKQSEQDFFERYNSPLFSGIPYKIPLQIKNSIPTTNEDEFIKMKEYIQKEQIIINAKIENLGDLIELCNTYPLADNLEYNINMNALHKIKPSIIELQGMIGMKTMKENIVDQILYFIQDLHTISPNNTDYMHTVICGPPGTGKTEVAKIMGKIFSNLGMLKNNVFKKVTRDDLVAGFLGQTAIKTKDIIKECVGGVLFIDEAYALGNSEKRDSFSKECIDTICEALSDHKKDLMCIIAGYEHELKDCFFSYNTGLESRFTWKFTIDEYSANELRQIFEKKVRECGWNLKEPLCREWFEKNKEYFKYFGRDMETLFSKVKIAHSRRVFCLPKEEKTHIIMEDLEKGFTVYKQMGSSEKHVKEQARLKQIYSTIYC